MANKIVVVVLGNRNSGKSTTWNRLFGTTVKTGTRERLLQLHKSKSVSVFLVSGSPEERSLYVGDIIGNSEPKIVLCSMQYTESVSQTIEFFRERGYSFYVQWLNPGFSDPAPQQDNLGLFADLIDSGAIVSKRDGKVDCTARVEEIRDFIHGWAAGRGLI
ncbi:MAG: hypothetical protein EOP84_01980 [Verrucomicrobiaceae bacterium]|nr:MAG: hypothetical protein EOP84_01980 [Verrucomicrobiaceae bacterium]